jgi:hypothetical protein
VAATDVSSPPDAWPRRRVLLWAGVIGLATLALRLPSVAYPGLVMDDFQLAQASWTWRAARDNLWAPHNEHSMPLGRLSTWLLIRLAGAPERVPQVLILQGPLAVLAAAVLAYLFVRRETGHPLPGLVAMALFGVSTHYQQAAIWFAASFAILGLDMLLLGLLAAQRWRRTGRGRWLALSAFWCALAPGWFASGVLAGPLCALYLLGPDPHPAGGDAPPGRARRLAALAPVLGTAASLAVTLPRNAARILNLPRVEVDRTAAQTFDVGVGLRYTLRALVDDLVPGLLGFEEWTTPAPWVWVLLPVLATAAVAWWRVAGHRSLLLLGAGTILSSYLLVFSGRSYFPYEAMHHWGRYHLFAHLGLVLYLCGGWPCGRRLAARALVPGWRALALLGLLYATQAPRCSYLLADPQEAEELRRIAEAASRP